MELIESPRAHSPLLAAGLVSYITETRFDEDHPLRVYYRYDKSVCKENLSENFWNLFCQNFRLDGADCRPALRCWLDWENYGAKPGYNLVIFGFQLWSIRQKTGEMFRLCYGRKTKTADLLIVNQPIMITSGLPLLSKVATLSQSFNSPKTLIMCCVPK